MSREVERLLQFACFIVLAFFGPPGWACIYLLWKEWNPAPVQQPAAHSK